MIITTPKKIGEIQVTQEPVIVFYKENDTIKVSDVKALLDQDVRFEAVTDRDDMLVLFGTILATNPDSNIVLIDDTIPVPKRYEDRVKTSVTKPAARTSRSWRKPAAKKKEEPAAEKSEEKTEVTEVKAEAPAEQPVTSVPAQENPEPTEDREMTDEEIITHMQESGLCPQEDDPKFESPETRKAYELIQMKSMDVGFTWNTEMLMSRILDAIFESETDKDIRSSLMYQFKSLKLVQAVFSHLAELKELAKAYC